MEGLTMKLAMVVAMVVGMVAVANGLHHSLIAGRLKMQGRVNSVRRSSVAPPLSLGVTHSYSKTDALAMTNFAFIAYCLPQIVQNWNCVSCPAEYSGHTNYLDTDAGLAYVTHNGKDTIVVAFQGTSWQYKPVAVLLDLDFQPYALTDNSLCTGCKCPSCTVHQGFFDVYSGYVSFVDNAVAQAMKALPTTTPKVMITGHSLGAAAAALYALHYTLIKPASAPKPIIYTFGMPKVGNLDFVNFYSQHVPYHYAMIHNQDIVPHLPPSVFNVLLVPHLYWCPTGIDSCYAMPGLTDTANLFNLHLSVDDHVNYFNFTTRGTNAYSRSTNCGSP